MPGGWEGNRSLASHASQILMVLHLQAQGLVEGDEHLPTLSFEYDKLTFFVDNRNGVIPDDVDVFRHLAKLYSFTHPTMHLGAPCPNNGERFPDGIISGWAWYAVTGGVLN